MALVKTEELGMQIAGFSSLSMGRQLGLMVGLAASVALAVSIVLWSQNPSYRMLYGNLSDQEVLEVSSALDQASIPYEINETTGAVLVGGARIHEARMRLAGLGLPKGSGTGYELLEKEQGFGTSQFMETARYQRAIEGELSRTISSLNNVQSARVHLAIPKQSSFVRNKKKPSASVMLNLYQGRTMAGNQAASITHLVASSIPSLEAGDVTVVDQNGRLLTSPSSSEEAGYASNQFEHQKNLEKYYIKRIEEIVEPIVGIGRVRAQVVADLDFTVTEQTLESYNPDLPSIRSEQTIEEDSTGSSTVSGVPGTLSNQPGVSGSIGGDSDAQSGGAKPSKNSSRRIVKNYELDRTISHVRHQTGRIKRLSAAVVIGNKLETDESLTDAELQRVTALIKEAIGFNVARGDSVNVINTAFQTLPEPEPLPETPLLEQPWLWDVLKQALGIGLFLFVIFGVLKPILKSLAEKGVAARAAFPSQNAGNELAEFGGIPSQLSGPSYEQQVESAKTVAQSEPQRVAQVVKDWVEVD